MHKTALMVLLWSLCLLHLEGSPISKRSISEVQLMHNVGERKQVLERQDWLQVKLKSILIPSVNDLQKGQKGKA
ncbi:parathyroid hormone 1b [Salminus brasiliensis]|uniref:parathyroid hormone 1b n=1 Tax=Salminus brasiliensis TaxID=930266 RepID=UPI003B8381B0